MADEEQLAILRQGVEAWNAWRLEHPDIKPDLGWANLSRAYLVRANLRGANLNEANLSGADLRRADFRGAYFGGANLSGADLRGTDLRGVNLECTHLVGTRLVGANLTGCRVYGISAWDLHLEGATQADLIITRQGQPQITVDNLEVAQFIYLLLNNERVRHVIDAITTKVVLILGHFTPERKAVLDALREELRKRDYLPVLFDFEKPAGKDLTGTVQILANMARFVIADLTDPSSVPHELAMVVPSTVVPVQPVLLEGQREYAMFLDLKRRHHWVLEPYCYDSPERLITELAARVIDPAEAKARNIRTDD
jgi:Pentapeptide repeats (8 copies)